ncbi:hypothetical protein CEUSTIGMA_g441.t1 [Chlamydomonas eustigma]|uniref:Uncharacterized protein n=1 Tax=Chlamydomonas eustigma TaxID=1157962 RepID=A0A250WQM3_9CHLO|nr:hypothetical protein CEUSTIGMA_g441.t1 [Chlamydomonas eustigma]|eukprot:GAX72989.1 hypothetical protein CEUSTIGMA_g441.t1 [Chlamydomonas eustigma]
MYRIKQHSAVSELLGQLLALTYERDFLKYAGRLKNARKIDRILNEIGYKSIHLLDPVSRLLQEYEELSEVIHTALDNVPHKAAMPASLINKLHLVLAHAKDTHHHSLLAHALERGGLQNQHHNTSVRPIKTTSDNCIIQKNASFSKITPALLNAGDQNSIMQPIEDTGESVHYDSLTSILEGSMNEPSKDQASMRTVNPKADYSSSSSSSAPYAQCVESLVPPPSIPQHHTAPLSAIVFPITESGNPHTSLAASCISQQAEVRAPVKGSALRSSDHSISKQTIVTNCAQDLQHPSHSSAKVLSSCSFPGSLGMSYVAAPSPVLAASVSCPQETVDNYNALLLHPSDHEHTHSVQEEMQQLRLRNQQLEHESSLVRAELNHALAVAEIQGSLISHSKALPFQSQVAVRELLAYPGWNRQGMWHPTPRKSIIPVNGLASTDLLPEYKDVRTNLTAPVPDTDITPPVSLPKPSRKLLQASQRDQSVLMAGGRPMNTGSHNFKEGEKQHHCLSGRSSARLFEPVMEDIMDFMLPAFGWKASETGSYQYGKIAGSGVMMPPASPPLSRLVSLMDSQELSSAQARRIPSWGGSSMEAPLTVLPVEYKPTEGSNRSGLVSATVHSGTQKGLAHDGGSKIVGDESLKRERITASSYQMTGVSLVSTPPQADNGDWEGHVQHWPGATSSSNRGPQVASSSMNTTGLPKTGVSDILEAAYSQGMNLGLNTSGPGCTATNMLELPPMPSDGCAWSGGDLNSLRAPLGPSQELMHCQKGSTITSKKGVDPWRLTSKNTLKGCSEEMLPNPLPLDQTSVDDCLVAQNALLLGNVSQELPVHNKHISFATNAADDSSGPFELVFWGKGGSRKNAPAFAGKCTLTSSRQLGPNRPKKSFKMEPAMSVLGSLMSRKL